MKKEASVYKIAAWLASAWLGLAAALYVTASDAQTPNLGSAPPTQISYDTSVYADYLYYLFYRPQEVGPEITKSLPLTGVKPLKDSSFLPEEVAQGGIHSYADLYKAASSYDDRDQLEALLRGGEPYFASFSRLWRQYFEPKELGVIDKWKDQERKWDVVSHLEMLERLPVPFSHIVIHVSADNPSGASMPSSQPSTMIIFTTTAVPSLAWVVGHEATHQVLHRLHGIVGKEWETLPGGQEAIRLMKENGGAEYDVEEALCLLMQAKLSIAAGFTKADYLSSNSYTKDTPRRRLLLAMERDWNSYLATSGTDIAQWMIAETIKTFGAPG